MKWIQNKFLGSPDKILIFSFLDPLCITNLTLVGANSSSPPFVKKEKNENKGEQWNTPHLFPLKKQKENINQNKERKRK